MGISLLRSIARARPVSGRTLLVLGSMMVGMTTAPFLAAPAQAQGMADNGLSGKTTVAPPGSIILQRDVQTRNIAKAYEPGIVTFAMTDPGVQAFTGEIDELIPLSDVESATMSAGLPLATTIPSAGSAIDVGLNASLSGALDRGVPDAVQMPGSAFGDAIGSATGALNSAVGAGMDALQGAMAPLTTLPGGGN